METAFYIGFSIVLALLIILRRNHQLKMFLLPTLLFENDDSVIGKSLSANILIIASVFTKIVLAAGGGYIVKNNGFQGVIRDILSVGIAIILLEWILVIIVKGVLALTDKYFETNDGRFLVVSSFWVFISTYYYSSKHSWLPMVIVLFVVINLAVSFKYMINLFIKREDYLKQEFGMITAANQLYAIVMLIGTQIVNYVMLVYMFINSDNDFKLLYGGDLNKEVSDFWDVVYYVIITYTTVGYGDITPYGSIGKVVASMISFTSFFMSVAVIGIILSFSISKTVQNKRKHNS